ncbi:MAG: glycosyltransferase family 39 protein [Gemmataceae bacterium]|nr:glycosyltransferase family 39 protein [Gemmataceae bacterium]
MLQQSSRAVHYSLILGAALLLFFWGLGEASLWDVDEGRNATAALEMMHSGDYIVPKYNGELRDHKPVLLYWIQIAAYSIFGTNEFGARFPSALSALLTLIVCYELARAMFSPASGLASAMVVATSPMIIGGARFANPDSLLTAFSTLVMLVYWRGYRQPTRPWYFLLGAVSGLAMMAKGPVGVVLPGGIAFIHSWMEGRWRLWFDRRILWNVLAFTLVGLTWYIWVAALTHADFLRGFFLTHNVNRFFSPRDEHGGTLLFYILVLFIGMIPWSVYFGPALWYGFWSAIRDPWPKHAERWDFAVDRTAPGEASAYRLLMTWAVFYFVFYSIAATKLPNYMLPAAAPLGILIGRYLDRWRLNELPSSVACMRRALIAQAASAIAFAVAMSLLGGMGKLAALERWIVPGLERWLWIVVLPPIAIVVLWPLLATNRTRALEVKVASALAFFGPIGGLLVGSFDALKPAEPLVMKSGAGDTSKELAIYAYRMDHLASLNFYLQRPVRHLDAHFFHLKTEEECNAGAAQKLKQILAAPMPVCVFLPAHFWDEFRKTNPGLGQEAARHRDMYKRSDGVAVMNDAANQQFAAR